MILLWGIDGDGPLDAVRHHLDQLGAAHHFANQRHHHRLAVDLDVDRRGRPAGTLRLGHLEIDLASISACYVRPYATDRVTAQRPATEADAALRTDLALAAFADVCPGRVLNRPGAMASNQSKPYQAELLRRLGFAVPPTLITSDPDAARLFTARHGRVIYKSISGIRSIVRSLTPADDARFDDVAGAPTQFQAHIEGDDVRVHVVGSHCFATLVECDADDYRYAPGQGDDAWLEAVDLPAEVADRCVAASRALGLELAGIDLRLTPDGRWFCFEANPSPAFTFYEEATGQPIAAAVAQLLADPVPTPRRRGPGRPDPAPAALVSG